MRSVNKRNLTDSKLVVIKIGTSSLVNADGSPSQQSYKKIADEVSSAIKSLNKQVVLVSSGAISTGATRLKASLPLKTIQEKQAAAAIGQGLLMMEYEKAFEAKGLITAQVLLTRDAIDDRQRYINCRNTIGQILKFGAIPIINENDTVSVDEIKVGDNDTLSALVANLIGADLLILLSDVDGFLMDGKVLPTIDKISKEIENKAGGSGSGYGTGGMMTKLQAAKISTSAGIPMIIANCGSKDVITKILSGDEIGTLFTTGISKVESRKRWLLSGKKPAGRITVDDGAFKALTEKCKSLLPVGIKEIKGIFDQGDIISVYSPEGREIGRGMTNYSSEELAMIKGKKSSEALNALGVLPSDEVVHRDNMVMI